jgi:beta-lactamase superfamily II metal-dependent hydrolase
MAISHGRPIVPEEIAPSAKNDDALVFRSKFRVRSFLLPGDAEKLSGHYVLLNPTLHLGNLTF